MEFDVTVM